MHKLGTEGLHWLGLSAKDRWLTRGLSNLLAVIQSDFHRLLTDSIELLGTVSLEVRIEWDGATVQASILRRRDEIERFCAEDLAI